jgi:hypothetical protein
MKALQDHEPWGMREFSIKTPDVHRIKIGQSLGSRRQ